MIVELIKEILQDYRNSISIEKLETILSEKNLKIHIPDIVNNNNNIFSLSNNIVFIKSSLIEQKNIFFNEFTDFLKNKIQDLVLLNDIINNYKGVIPDIFVVEWIDIPLERKLYIFDLLYNLIIKPKRIKDKLKIYFNNLIEFYSLIVIYSILVIKNYEENFAKLINFIEKIEPQEEILKNHLFNILTIPDIVKLKLNFWENELNLIEIKSQIILEEFFNQTFHYSKILIKRIINKELNNFNITQLLLRFDFKSFYEWLLVLTENNSNNYNNNLFNDFDIHL